MSSADLFRTVLPIPERPHVGLTTYDAKDPDTSFPPIEPLLPPEGAPNVLVILLDDVGFGASSAFGGPVEMPVAERLQAGGLSYTRFHTTALCAPTRAGAAYGPQSSLGRDGDDHRDRDVGSGGERVRPNTKAPLATTLKLNGYSTAQFGKCHEVPPWQTSPVGPFDAWPSGGGGFETFYGFIGGENNQYYPALYDGHVSGRAGEDAGGGLSPDRGSDRPGDRLGEGRRRRWRRRSRSSCTSRRVRRTRRTMCRWSGRTSTRASSPTAGMPCASRRSSARSSVESWPRTRS